MPKLRFLPPLLASTYQFCQGLGGARLWVVWGFLFPLRFDSGGFCPGPNCLGRACSGSALQPQVTDPPRKGVLKGTMATWGWLPPLSLTARSVVGSPPTSLLEILRSLAKMVARSRCSWEGLA